MLTSHIIGAQQQETLEQAQAQTQAQERGQEQHLAMSDMLALTPPRAKLAPRQVVEQVAPGMGLGGACGTRRGNGPMGVRLHKSAFMGKLRAGCVTCMCTRCRYSVVPNLPCESALELIADRQVTGLHRFPAFPSAPSTCRPRRASACLSAWEPHVHQGRRLHGHMQWWPQTEPQA